MKALVASVGICVVLFGHTTAWSQESLDARISKLKQTMQDSVADFQRWEESKSKAPIPSANRPTFDVDRAISGGGTQKVLKNLDNAEQGLVERDFRELKDRLSK